MARSNGKLLSPAVAGLSGMLLGVCDPTILGPAMAQQYCDTRTMTQAYVTQMTCVDSYLRSQKGNRYDVMSMTDGDSATAWCEGDPGDGIGIEIKVTFEEAAPPLTLHIKNGNHQSMDHFLRNSRVKDFRLTMISYDSEVEMRSTVLRLRDEPLEQEMRIPWEIENPRQLVLEIVSVYPGSRYQDTCLSGFFVGYGM